MQLQLQLWVGARLKMKMNQKILSARIIWRGNHFIWLDNIGWTLIDGPWFWYLNGRGRQYVRTSYFTDPFNPNVVALDDAPLEATFLMLDWEQVRWFPGSQLPLAKWKSCWNWWEYLSGRGKFGWRTLPDGKLPAYLNRLEIGKSPQHDEEIRWLERHLV